MSIKPPFLKQPLHLTARDEDSEACVKAREYFFYDECAKIDADAWNKLVDVVEPLAPLTAEQALANIREAIVKMSAYPKSDEDSAFGKFIDPRDPLPYFPVATGRRLPDYFPIFREAGLRQMRSLNRGPLIFDWKSGVKPLVGAPLTFPLDINMDLLKDIGDLMAPEETPRMSLSEMAVRAGRELGKPTLALNMLRRELDEQIKTIIVDEAHKTIMLDEDNYYESRAGGGKTKAINQIPKKGKKAYVVQPPTPNVGSLVVTPRPYMPKKKLAKAIAKIIKSWGA
jgi:hypothetical protein